MTFQDKKTTGKFWDKTKAKREELHDRDVEKANHPTVIAQDEEDVKQQSKKNSRGTDKSL